LDRDQHEERLEAHFRIRQIGSALWRQWTSAFLSHGEAGPSGGNWVTATTSEKSVFRPRGEIPTKTLLTVKSAIELLAGLALAVFPSMSVSFLLGSPLDAPAGTVLGRIAGTALLTLGIACWLASHDSQSRAAAGLIAALLCYDAGVVIILLFAHFAMGLSGIFLFPAIVLHSGLGIWSLLCLRKTPRWPLLG
jgi:hypothetical protein